MEREYYAIAKVPTPDIADPYKYVPRDTELLFFTGGIQAIKYMQQQLEFPQEPSMSWDNPKNPTNDPKNPNKPIGLTQSYIVFKTPIGSPLQVDASTEQIPGCIGHAQRERHATVHAAMMGRDSVSDTIKYLLYYPRREFAVTPQEELDNRIKACKTEYLAQLAAANRANSTLPDTLPDVLPDEITNGQDMIDFFDIQLREQGLGGYAINLSHTFTRSLIAKNLYDSDSLRAAYEVIQDVFGKISRADLTHCALTRNPDEICKWARRICEWAGEMQSHPADAWGNGDPYNPDAPYDHDYLSQEDAERLLGCSIERF